MNPYELMTLLSEEEIFGFSGEERKIVEVLKKCEIPGNYFGAILNIFKQRSVYCPITDLALMLNGNPNQIFTTTPDIKNKYKVVTYSQDGTYSSISQNDKTGIIRPVINIGEEENLDSFEDFEKIEYGEYPQFVAKMEMQKTLEQELQSASDKIKELDEAFSIECKINPSYEIDLLRFKVFQYENKKYIRVPITKKYDSEKIIIKEGSNTFCWIEVAPIVWLLDKKSRKLISEKGLVSNISFQTTNSPSYSGFFINTQVYYFLSSYFLPEMLQSISSNKTIDMKQIASKKM